MKIALVSLQKDAERVPPVGLVYLATYLNERTGIKAEDIKIFEANYCEDIESGLYDFSPDIVGFSSMTVDYGKVIKFANKLYLGYPALFILGGVHISSLPESLDKRFNIGVIGEGEETFAEIVSLAIKKEDITNITKSDLKKINGLVYWNKNKLEYSQKRDPIKNLDDLPIPNFRFIDARYFKKEEIPSISELGIKGFMMTSRGCPFRCRFCSTARFWGSMRFHSPEYTAKMACRLINDFGVDYLKIMDDLFTVSPDRLKEIKAEFDKLGVLGKIKAIECQPRANLMTNELCEAMKELKIKTVNFGFESGSDKMLKWLKQDSVTVEMNKNAVLLCEKYGLNCYGSLMYGSPGETIEDMEKTNEFIQFAIEHKARYLWSFISTPFPMTPFWDIALERGKASSSMDWNLLSHHNICDPLLLDGDIDKKEFKKTFLKGRDLLKSLKMKVIKDFVMKNPFSAAKMILKEPRYYISRAYRQVFKQ